MVFSTERIIYLLRGYTDRTATDAERQELTDWLALHEDDGSFENHIQQLMQAYPAERKAEGVDWERIYSVILAERNEASSVHPIAHRVHFLKTSWFRYAAAVLLMLGIGSYFWLTRQEIPRFAQDDSRQGRSDIKPGTNRAVLTIGGNRKIDLASNKTGIAVSNTITYTDGEEVLNQVQHDEDILQLTTPRGGQYQAVLPDGSKVWLNAASSIRFPSKFDGKERVVEISGEAYLEIARNLKQPFVVKANGAEIQVLGTSFNVNAYEDEASVKTTLVEGSVKVILRQISGGAKEATLKPGEQGEAVSGDVKLIKDANVAEAIAWRNGLFNFNKLSLQSVMRQLSRWYDVDVVYEGSVQPKKFGGELQRDLNLSEVLEVLKETGVHFKVDGKKLIVQP